MMTYYGKVVGFTLNLYQGIHPWTIDIAVITLATIDTYVDILRSKKEKLTKCESVICGSPLLLLFKLFDANCSSIR